MPRPFAAAVLPLVMVLLLPEGGLTQGTAGGARRIVAVGDVHGGFDEFVGILRAAGLVDQRRRWRGGTAHLVQTGDVLDRGPHSRKVLDLLMDLERQAARAGGRVHALIGNHEVMNLVGDLRYVTEGEYEAFRSRDAAALRDRAFELLADPVRREDPASRERWDREHPLGWVEHQQAFGPNGKYGKWIRQRDAVARVGDILFLHGGISPQYADLTVDQINDRVRQELADFSRLEGGLAVSEEGPLWYRGLAQGAEAGIEAHVDRLLAFHGVRHVVIGHTSLAPAIVPRFNGKVIAIDVGLGPHYGGPPAALLIEDGHLFALHRGRRLPLPTDGRLRPYLEKAAALDPAPSPLLKVIDTLAPAAAPPAAAQRGSARVAGHG